MLPLSSTCGHPWSSTLGTRIVNSTYQRLCSLVLNAVHCPKRNNKIFDTLWVEEAPVLLPWLHSAALLVQAGMVNDT